MFSTRAMQSALKLTSAAPLRPTTARLVAPALRRYAGTAPSNTTTNMTGSSGGFASNPANTKRTTPAEAQAILAAQRIQRPVAPHLSIYQPQLTWILSSMNRVTGVLLSGAAYLYFIGYAIAPYAGWHFESTTIAAAFAGMGIASKMAIKAVASLPFTFHSWNGIRHLLWDTGKMLHIKGVYATGYAVLALTALSTIGLVMI